MENSAVEKRIGLMSVITILSGYVLTVNNVTIGAQLAVGTGFARGMIVLIVGYLITTVLWTLAGMIGPRERLTSAELLRYSFGTSGSRIPSTIVGIALPVWAVLDYMYGGEMIMSFMPGNPKLGFILGAGLFLVCCIMGAIKGITSLKWLNNISVPFTIVLFIVVIAVVTNQAGGFGAFLEYQPETPMATIMGINVYVASWVCSPTFCCDFTHTARTQKLVLIGMPVAMLIIPLMFVIGMIGVTGAGVTTVAALATKLGGLLLVCVHLFTVFCTITSMPTNNHMFSTELSAVTKLPERLFVIGIPILCSIVSYLTEFYFGGFSLVLKWVGIVGVIFGPTLTIFLVHYWIVLKGKLSNQSLESTPAFSKATMISLFTGFVVGLILTYAVPNVPSTILAMIYTGVIYYILKCVVQVDSKHRQVAAEPAFSGEQAEE